MSVNPPGAGGPADDFALSIAWFGESDKPRREAVLASASRAASIGEEPLVERRDDHPDASSTRR